MYGDKCHISTFDVEITFLLYIRTPVHYQKWFIMSNGNTKKNDKTGCGESLFLIIKYITTDKWKRILIKISD